MIFPLLPPVNASEVERTQLRAIWWRYWLSVIQWEWTRVGATSWKLSREQSESPLQYGMILLERWVWWPLRSQSSCPCTLSEQSTIECPIPGEDHRTNGVQWWQWQLPYVMPQHLSKTPWTASSTTTPLNWVRDRCRSQMLISDHLDHPPNHHQP